MHRSNLHTQTHTRIRGTHTPVTKSNAEYVIIIEIDSGKGVAREGERENERHEKKCDENIKCQ